MFRSPRAWLWRALAVVVAVGTAIAVSGDLRALHAHAHDLGTPRRVVVAQRDLMLGHRITASDVGTVVRYGSQVPRGALHGTADAIGRVVTLSAAAGTVLLARNMAPGAAGYGAVLTADTRVVRVPDAQALDPGVGAVVDVIATYRDDTPGASGGGGLAVVVAAGAVVIEGDRSSTSTRADAGTTATIRDADLAVALLVRRSDVSRLASALANGQVVLALAPPEDACCSTH